MNYVQALQSVELVLAAGEVPLLVGATGIGKTTLAKSLAEKNGWYLVTIDGNLLKEGEIGGLPTVENRSTIYACHYKLKQISLLSEAGRQVLLFIDELNRCDHAVQQELMNLILNREINGYVLPNNVKLIGAMNPSDTYDYETVEMDKAQENRFVWLYLEPDYLQWLQWAAKEKLEPKIREFIATYPDYLQHANDDVNATPRSYERISKLYSIYKAKGEEISSQVFFQVVAGNVGKLIATELINFLAGEYAPLITYEEVFLAKELESSLVQRVQEETPTRLYLTMHNIIEILESRLSTEEAGDKEVNRWLEFLSTYPVDLQMGIMKEMRNNTQALAKAALANDNFIEAYFRLQGVEKK